MNSVSKPIAPLPMDTLHSIGTQAGPAEGTSEHQALEDQKGFSYRTLLGKIIYAYVSCRPDIGYPITLMSKYASNPSAYHYDKLKNIARYLCSTREWGIIFKRSAPRTELPEGTASQFPLMTSFLSTQKPGKQTNLLAMLTLLMVMILRREDLPPDMHSLSPAELLSISPKLN